MKRAPGPKAQGVARLLATWASDIRMNLDLSGHIGLVPAWEVTINRLQTGWGVAILYAWTEADQALWAGVLNFWFLGRVFDRVRP